MTDNGSFGTDAAPRVAFDCDVLVVGELGDKGKPARYLPLATSVGLVAALAGCVTPVVSNSPVVAPQSTAIAAAGDADIITLTGAAGTDVDGSIPEWSGVDVLSTAQPRNLAIGLGAVIAVGALAGGGGT